MLNPYLNENLMAENQNKCRIYRGIYKRMKKKCVWKGEGAWPCQH
jgi:hypothetical protein